jgi:HSP20 family protein
MRPAWLGNGHNGEETMPKMDIFEKEDKFVVKAELPGIKAEDIDISVTGDMLTIKAEKKSESEVKEENYYRREASYGSFARSIRLPSSVNVDKITASCEDGVLEIDLPKTGLVEPKKIPMGAKKAEPKDKAVDAKPKVTRTRAKKATATR